MNNRNLFDNRISRSSTFFVAASNSSERSKSQADHVCDGVSDDVEIQKAINALPSTGGSIVLSEGLFSISAKINLGVKSGISIFGTGYNSTTVQLANDVNDHVFLVGDGSTYVSGVRFADFTIEGNNTEQTAGSGIRLYSVEDSHFDNMKIARCFENGIEAEGTVGRHNVYVYVNNCYILNCLSGGVFANGFSYAVNIVNSTIAACGTSPAGNGGFRSNGNSDHVLSGVLFDENSVGCRIYDSSYLVISGCLFLNQSRHGILCDGSSHSNVICGNLIISPSNGSPDTYSGISTDGDYNQIVGNEIYGLANRIDAGVKELAGADGNVVALNMIRNSLNGITKVGANTVVFKNSGYVTENSGLASITGAVNSVSVSHGLSLAPTRVFVTPIQTGQGDFAVTARDVNTFTISFVAQPGVGTWYFDWKAQVGEG